MQTFLPYPDFARSAACLDYRRLGKQRVEAHQMLRAITFDEYKGWQNHPAVRMWRGYTDALAAYRNACILEWIRRGYRNTMLLHEVQRQHRSPEWLGNADFHAAHRAALLYKHPTYYQQFRWIETPQIAYIWPVD